MVRGKAQKKRGRPPKPLPDVLKLTSGTKPRAVDKRGLGSRIRSLRNELNMTPAQFAQWICSSERQVGQWERGRVVPSGAALYAILQRTGKAIDWLLSGTGPDESGLTRSRRELEDDLADYVGRGLADRNAVADDEEGNHYHGAWLVDGPGLLKDVLQDEIDRVRRWEYYERAVLSVSTAREETIQSLRELVPHLPADSREAGRAVQHIGQAAHHAVQAIAGLKRPKEPNASPQLRFTLWGGSAYLPSDALEEFVQLAKERQLPDTNAFANRAARKELRLREVKPTGG